MKFLSLIPVCVALALPLAGQTAPAWRLVPEATFGASGDPTAEFSDIRGVEVSKSGNVLVLDYKAHNIRVFAPDGKFLKVIGRGGEGPGEFGEPNGFARSPDGNIWVNDPANHRFSVHRDDGEYIRNVPSALTGYGYIWRRVFRRRRANGEFHFHAESEAVGAQRDRLQQSVPHHARAALDDLEPG